MPTRCRQWLYKHMKTTQELVTFEGMSCRFDGIPFEWEVAYNNGNPYIYAHKLVETKDGTRHRQDDCYRVYNSRAAPRANWSNPTFEWYTEDQLDLSTKLDLVKFCDESNVYAYSQYTCYCDHSGTDEHLSDVTYFDGEYYLNSSGLLLTDGDGDTFLDGDDDYYYCDGEWWHESRCHYCPEEGEHVFGDSDECEACNPPSGDRVYRYHRSGISPHIYRDFNGSGFAVGFEVEKNSVMGADSEGDQIDGTDLFAYWETDASCGIEGVTHAYDPLDPAMIDSFKVDVSNALSHLNASCDSSCGGHVNISSTNHSPRELMNAFRAFAPLWYAVYRHRLNNSYCRNDKKIEHGSDKYSPVITKSFGIEIRLPSRIHSGDQLLRRFEWVGETCKAIRDGATFNQYVKACRPLLFHGAYASDRKKYARVLRLARKFRIWMLDGIADQSIHQWI